MQSSVLKSNQTSVVAVGGKINVEKEEIELKKNQIEPRSPDSVVFVNNDTHAI